MLSLPGPRTLTTLVAATGLEVYLLGWWCVAAAEVAEPRIADLSDDKCRGVPCQQSCDAAVGNCICHDGYRLVGTRCEGSPVFSLAIFFTARRLCIALCVLWRFVGRPLHWCILSKWLNNVIVTLMFSHHRSRWNSIPPQQRHKNLLGSRKNCDYLPCTRLV